MNPQTSPTASQNSSPSDKKPQDPVSVGSVSPKAPSPKALSPDKGRRRPRVVIIGGGFAGLNAAKALRRAPVDVVLVDRTNHHVFQPLLYQVATAALSPRDIGRPLRDVLRRQSNASVLMANVVGFDLDQRRVLFEDGDSLGFDRLVVAVGARHSYFGRDEWESVAPGLKTIADALDLRRRILLEFERAERFAKRERPSATDEAASPAPTFVVVGAGPTGVEMAGAIAEIAKKTMLRDFRAIRPEDTRVVLVEAAPRVLPPFPEELSANAERQLEDLGVDVRTGLRVTDIDRSHVELEAADGTRETLRTNCVIWAAGNEAPALLRGLPAAFDRNGRVEVQPDLSLAQDPDVFVLGDAAHVRDEEGAPLPGLAPVAMQQGRHVAKVIREDLDGRPRTPFRYVDKGTMATIGKARAVAWIGRLRFGGLFAWLAWSLVHILFLVGFRTRIVVMLEWIFLYVFQRRDARLIHGWTRADGSQGGRTPSGDAPLRPPPMLEGDEP